MEQATSNRAATLTAGQREALRIIATVSPHRFDLYDFSGNRNVRARQRLLELWTGTKPTQNRAGINILERTIYNALAIVGDCKADEDEQFAAIARDLVQDLN